jgi:hypothetical protein
MWSLICAYSSWLCLVLCYCVPCPEWFRCLCVVFVLDVITVWLACVLSWRLLVRLVELLFLYLSPYWVFVLFFLFLSLGQCIPAALYSCGTVFLWHCIPMALYSCGTVFLRHCIPVALYSCGTVFLWHCIPAALYSCGTVFLRHCIPVALYSCGTVFLWHCIPVELWYFCGVTVCIFTFTCCKFILNYSTRFAVNTPSSDSLQLC